MIQTRHLTDEALGAQIRKRQCRAMWEILTQCAEDLYALGFDDEAREMDQFAERFQAKAEVVLFEDLFGVHDERERREIESRIASIMDLRP